MTIERRQVENSYFTCYTVTFSKETIAEDSAFLAEASKYEFIEDYEVKDGVASAKVFVGDDGLVEMLNKFC